MELLTEPDDEEEKNVPVDVADDNNYDNSDLFCGEVDGEDYVCAQAFMRNLLPILSNHADKCFVPTVFEKITVNYVDVDYPITTIDFDEVE